MIRQTKRIGLQLCAILVLAVGCTAWAADPTKVLRVASPDIETLDPQQLNDIPSRDVVAAIFEGLYERDYLASPAGLVPVTAAGLPTISEDGKLWMIRLQPGIFFTDDPAFQGKPRELVAEDYVYSLKRWLDPNLRRGGAPITTDLIIGARGAVDTARQPGAKFDYDRPIEGLRATDRYTLEIRLREANYPVIEDFLIVRAAAREVVESAGGDIRTRAVGTGPYRLKEWKRGSRIVLEANPRYRSLRFPPSSDPTHAALVRSMQGKALPQVGIVEISFIEEDTTRLLEFERGRLDYVLLRGEIANRLLENGKLKPDYEASGVRRVVFPEPFLFSVYFNIEDPVIGGMSKERIGLRRAIALGFDKESLVKVVYADQALSANQIVPPRLQGHDPTLRQKPSFDQPAANAMLDRVGYGNRDSEGFRKAPDGKALALTLTLRSGGIAREVQSLWKKNMDALGLRTSFRVTPFQDAIKELAAGEYQMYFGGYGGSASGYAELLQLHGKQPPTANASRFKSPEYDDAMERFLRSTTEAERVVAARKMSELAQMYLPLLPTVFRLENDYVQPWLLGFAPPVFSTYWKYLDIDVARRQQSGVR